MTMLEIDLLRTALGAAREQVRQVESWPESVAHGITIADHMNGTGVLEDRWAAVRDLERQVDSAIAAYHAQPRCPFCRRARMVVTGNVSGRLVCEACRSIALQGIVQPVVHVPTPVHTLVHEEGKLPILLNRPVEALHVGPPPPQRVK